MTDFLYPFKFKTIFKDKIWGGQKLRTYLGKDFSPLPNCGETWEISGVAGNLSVVEEGIHAGKTLPELIEMYQDSLLGKKVYARFNTEFPLLIKFIDANDDLSIQVHPGDALAKKRHNSFGKTEMWYILQADEGARLNTGFNQQIDPAIYLKHLSDNTLEQILNFEKVNSGDVFYLPAGRVHYIGKGICLAEIQQTSDITYRIYDFDRKDDHGNLRELHTDLALEAIDFNVQSDYKTAYTAKLNESSPVVTSPYFITNIIHLDKEMRMDYSALDSFVIFIILEGSVEFHYPGGNLQFNMGDCILIPAQLKKFQLYPSGKSKLLEVYLPYTP